MYGPYETEQDAVIELREAIGDVYAEDDVWRVFMETCTRSEITLGRFESRVLRWLVESRRFLIIWAVRALILRAYDAGCARGEASANFRQARANNVQGVHGG